MPRIKKDGTKAVNSRAKGTSFERTVANKLKERGFYARRGQQFCGANGDPDVVSSIDLGFMKPHLECKAVESLNVFKALKQAKNDLKLENEVATVVWKKNNQKPVVVIELDDYLDLIEKILELSV